MAHVDSGQSTQDKRHRECRRGHDNRRLLDEARGVSRPAMKHEKVIRPACRRASMPRRAGRTACDLQDESRHPASGRHEPEAPAGPAEFRRADAQAFRIGNKGRPGPQQDIAERCARSKPFPILAQDQKHPSWCTVMQPISGAHPVNRPKVARLRRTTQREVGSPIAAALSRWVMVRDTVSMVRPR